jgi:hypothetical protein
MPKIKNWSRYDGKGNALKQPHWQNDDNGHVVYISYNPNIGGFESDKKWSAVWRESRVIDSRSKNLGEFENREDALNRAKNYIKKNPMG